ncbi:CoA transferase [Microbacterium sp. P05]|uniref:CoA transferase n=1 Tax=Microbacterium sp. P05 TaxID=3366948 RepID=UPI003747313D
MNAEGRFARVAARSLSSAASRSVSPSAGISWRSIFPVAELALDSVGFVSAQLDRAGDERGVEPSADATLDPATVAASFGSERLFRINGAAPQIWAPLSGFFRAEDGWVRTHANYPHHAAALRALLDLDADAGAEEVRQATARWGRFALEEAAVGAGAVVAAVREQAEWAQHPQAEALENTPLIGHRVSGAAAARPWSSGALLPLDGVRVLDLTRVIAGPIATRDLASAGAEVLRIDDPHRPEADWQHLDTGQNKRTARLDLTVAADRDVFDRLLAAADVLVTGYRPTALDRFGLSPAALADSHPGLVIGSVSAWGSRGPWSRRRGFDSIVQATIGIALAEQEAQGTQAPGALPVQALDHASGHLLAAAIVHALVAQRTDGGSHEVSVALARTGMELARHHDGSVIADVGGPLPTTTLQLDDGATLTCAPPPLAFSGAPTGWGFVHRWGTDAAAWSANG